MNNPGRYLALVPPGEGVLTQNPGNPLSGWDFSTGIQFMPNEYNTFGIEFVSRHTDVPYFSGRGGVTSNNGWQSPIGSTDNFHPDLVKNENRLILSSIFRF